MEFFQFLFLLFLPLSDPSFVDQVEMGGKGRQHLRILRGLRGSEELEIGEEDDHSDEGGEAKESGKVTTVGQVKNPLTLPDMKSLILQSRC